MDSSQKKEIIEEGQTENYEELKFENLLNHLLSIMLKNWLLFPLFYSFNYSYLKFSSVRKKILLIRVTHIAI